MASEINNIQQSTFQPKISAKQISSKEAKQTFEPMTSFADEDEAIISSEAKLQYELEKFNSGEDNALDLALAGEIAKFTVKAEVNVINTKKEMIDTVLKIGE